MPEFIDKNEPDAKVLVLTGTKTSLDGYISIDK